MAKLNIFLGGSLNKIFFLVDGGLVNLTIVTFLTSLVRAELSFWHSIIQESLLQLLLQKFNRNQKIHEIISSLIGRQS